MGFSCHASPLPCHLQLLSLVVHVGVFPYSKSERAVCSALRHCGCHLAVDLVRFQDDPRNRLRRHGLYRIARHLKLGEFHASINAFRSPLMSWIIALLPALDNRLVLTGKLVNIVSYLACFLLLYIFTRRLWGSRTVASVAVLLFSLARGWISVAVGAVVPDFLFAAIVLGYFMILLGCLCRNDNRGWAYLGCLHGVAYFAKAFALPWLALCSAFAVLLSTGSSKERVQRLALAAVVPLIAALAWGNVLHSKYGVFTTGTQLRTNLLQWTLHAYDAHHDPKYALLRDTTQDIDEFTVDDPMPPHSWPWAYALKASEVAPKVLLAERHNLPAVLKETLIVATPGGLLAWFAMTWILLRGWSRYRIEASVAAVIAGAAVSLVLAYSMLVFDMRYLFPLVPLLLAVAARFLVPSAQWNYAVLRSVCTVLAVLGVCISLAYSSSPFRRIRRDRQTSSYAAARQLAALPVSHVGSRKLITLGAGPFPESGVGWEAGYKTAFFSGYRLTASRELLPNPNQIPDLMADIEKANSDIILLWGKPIESRYAALAEGLEARYPKISPKTIMDPQVGEVGKIFFTN